MKQQQQPQKNDLNPILSGFLIILIIVLIPIIESINI